MLEELVTPKGYHFWGESFAVIDGEDYPLNEMTPEQQSYIMTKVNLQALNAAYAGEAEFYAEGLPEFEEVFPELAKKREEKKRNRKP